MEWAFNAGRQYELTWPDTPHDLDKAKHWYQKAADLGHRESSKIVKNYDAYVLRFKAERLGAGQYKQRLALYEQAAELGDAVSAWRAASYHERGTGDVPRDLEKAKHWYLKASELGEKDASINASWVGTQAQSDYLKATDIWLDRVRNDVDKPVSAKEFQAYLLAAKAGHPRAQEQVGNMYKFGEGVWRNDVLGHEWNLRAARQDAPLACWIVAGNYQWGLGVLEDRAEARRWYEKAIELGYDQAKQDLDKLLAAGDETAEMVFVRGLNYELGDELRGIDVDFEKALENYRRAAEMGLVDAHLSVAGMYFDGKGVPQSYEEAAKWNQKACLTSPRPIDLRWESTRTYPNRTSGFSELRPRTLKSEPLGRGTGQGHAPKQRAAALTTGGAAALAGRGSAHQGWTLA